MATRLTSSVFSGILVMLALVGPASVVAQSGGGYSVDADWAKLPDGLEWNGSVTWITPDGQGNVLVLVRAAPYFRLFTKDGQFVRAWGEEGEFDSPHSVTFDSDGFIWATDSAGHVVYKYSTEGEVLMTLGERGVAGDNTSQDHFNQVNHLAFGPDGDIYVSDGYVNSRVVHFTKEGDFVRIIGGIEGSAPGELLVPHGVAVDSAGRILVNDSDNQRVSVFAADGSFVETWPFPSRGGIVVTANDTVYISDVNAGAVNVVRNGELVESIPVDARAHGLGVDTDGTIYVSDSRNRAVMRIKRVP